MLTLVLVLNVVAILCGLYITWKAYQDSAKWGLFFFFTPLVYYALSRFTNPIIAGVIVIGLQLYYVMNNWRTVGIPYVVLVLAWIGTMVLPGLAAT